MTCVQVSRSELDKVRTCKAGLNKMMARVLELKQVSLCLACILANFPASRPSWC